MTIRTQTLPTPAPDLIDAMGNAVRIALEPNDIT